MFIVTMLSPVLLSHEHTYTLNVLSNAFETR